MGLKYNFAESQGFLHTYYHSNVARRFALHFLSRKTYTRQFKNIVRLLNIYGTRIVRRDKGKTNMTELLFAA